MGMNQGDLQELLMVPAALAVLGFFLLVILVVLGYSMKWSVNLVDAGPIGFFYGLLTAIVMTIGGSITSVGIALATGTNNQWVLMLYSMTAAIIVLALMVQCNPFKAFLAYLCHVVFSTMGCIGVGIATALLMFLLSQTNMIKLPRGAPAVMGPMKSGWGSSSPPAPVDTRYITGSGGDLQGNPFGS